MIRRRGHASAARLVELSVVAPERSTFQNEALAVLRREVGFRCALFLALGDDSGDVRAGLALAELDTAYADVFAQRFSGFSRELAPVKARAEAAFGVAVDTDVLGASARDRHYYRELVAPAGGGHSLLCFLELRGAPLGVLMLGRESARAFRPRELDRVRDARPALTLGLAGFAAAPPSASRFQLTAAPARSGLTARERDIAELLCGGFSNREIACALGTLFRLAGQLERASPWAARRPPRLPRDVAPRV